jgi:nicotinate-nucleotide pyrophosphorylase (carboxylating)
MDWKSKRIRGILEAALIEDKAANDLTTGFAIDPRMRATASVVALQPCVVSGLGAIPVVLELYAALRTKGGAPPMGRFEVVSHPEIFDGVRVKKGQTLAVVRYNAAALLSTERVILNFMQRMSGIATFTNDYVRALAGTRTHVIDTRKTIPGLRALDKYAVSCGGGANHRQDLQDGILLKSNHIALAGGITKAVTKVLAKRGSQQPVQVEVRTLAELEEALTAGAESFLLSDMTPAMAKKAVKQIRVVSPTFPIEASGDITVAGVRDYAEAGVDFVSIGALTHSPDAADLSMRIAVDES